MNHHFLSYLRSSYLATVLTMSADQSPNRRSSEKRARETSRGIGGLSSADVTPRRPHKRSRIRIRRKKRMPDPCMSSASSQSSLSGVGLQSQIPTRKRLTFSSATEMVVKGIDCLC